MNVEPNPSKFTPTIPLSPPYKAEPHVSSYPSFFVIAYQVAPPNTLDVVINAGNSV